VKLAKWQKNDIYEAIAAGGLDPIECIFDVDAVGWRVAHVPSGSYFRVVSGPGHYNVSPVVGDTVSLDSRSFNWQTVPGKAERWAREVKRDVATPDLWDEVRRKHGILTGTTYEDTDNTLFTPGERAEIFEQVRQIKQYLKDLDSLTEARMLSIEERLDYVVSAADRVGRKDWKLMLSAAILGLILTDLLPREVVGDILTMASHGFDHFFGGGGLPQLPR